MDKSVLFMCDPGAHLKLYTHVHSHICILVIKLIEILLMKPLKVCLVVFIVNCVLELQLASQRGWAYLTALL